MKYSLFVGCPTYGKPSATFAMDSFGSLLYHIGRRRPEIEEVWVQRDVRTYRQEARQAIVMSAKEKKSTHLLMLDDDHVFGAEPFDIVWDAVMNNDKNPKMVSALYFTRGPTPAPCIFKVTKEGTAPIFFYPEKELFPIDVVGFGFVLFDMRLFEKIEPPWFNLAIGFGEDAAFCARMLQAGEQPYVHTGATIGHLQEQPMVVTEKMYLAFREQLKNVRGQVESHKLVPTGAEHKVDAGYTKSKQPWWRPISSRVWKRDAEVDILEATTESGTEQKEG